MTAGWRRMLLTVVVFAGVLSIGPFITPIPHGELLSSAELENVQGVAFGSSGGAEDTVVGLSIIDATGVPERGRLGARLLVVFLLGLGLGVVLLALARPLTRSPVRLRPVVALLPDRRGPPALLA